MNAGIDYGLGQTNIDLATGIRYGVISQNSVMPEALDDFYTQSKDLAWEQAQKELEEEYKDDPEKLEEEIQKLGDFWETSANNLKYDKEGYVLTGCLDNDLFVIKSPFYTLAQYCSPCVPGAGNLDCPMEEGVKTYCLGHDWFEGKAPYPVYSVETGERVTE